MQNSWSKIFTGLAALTLTSGLAVADDCDLCGAPPQSIYACDNDCAPKKCYETIKVPVPPKIECVKCAKPQKAKPVEDCVTVIRKSRVVGQVPVTTYKLVKEWVDSPVLEEYEEKISTVERSHVPVTDEIYHYVKVDGKVKKHRKDKCGNLVECDIPAVGKKGEFATQDLQRAGFYTGEKIVKKKRMVPGKVLKFKRVPVTVMQDKIEYYEERVPVANCANVKVEKYVEPKVRYVTKKVEVDCETKQPIAWNTAVEAIPATAVKTSSISTATVSQKAVEPAEIISTEILPAPIASESETATEVSSEIEATEATIAPAEIEPEEIVPDEVEPENSAAEEGDEFDEDVEIDDDENVNEDDENSDDESSQPLDVTTGEQTFLMMASPVIVEVSNDSETLKSTVKGKDKNSALHPRSLTLDEIIELERVTIERERQAAHG